MLKINNFGSQQHNLLSSIAGSNKSGISGVDEELFLNKKTIIATIQSGRSTFEQDKKFHNGMKTMRVSEMSVKEHDISACYDKPFTLI